MSDLAHQFQDLKQRKTQARIIHYSCESWFGVSDRPVAISCIAIVDLDSTNEISFSLTDYSDADVLGKEKKLLEAFYANIRERNDAIYVHWNMHSADFGFDAIDKRYKFLTQKEAPYKIPLERRFDLDSLISFKFGGSFAANPKLTSLAVLNEFNRRFFLSGQEEAEKFKNKEYGDLRRSTTEKAQLICFLTKRFLNGSLKINSSKIVFADQSIDAISVVTQVGERFKNVSNQLKKRRAPDAPLLIKNEYDFQYVFHALLRLFFDDVRAEEWTPKEAGSNKRMDFLIPKHFLAVELKHTREGLDAIKLGDELIVDIEHYKQHPKVSTIVCIVIDRENFIENPAGIESDLTRVQDDLTIVTKVF